MAYVEKHWDTTNDWTAFTSSGSGDYTISRDTAPTVRWIGGVGRIVDAWTVGAGSSTLTLTPSINHGRSLACSVAMRLPTTTWSGTAPQSRVGPIMFTARDSGATTLGRRLGLKITKAASGAVALTFEDLSNGSTSTASIDLRGFTSSWLLFYFKINSTGSAAPFTVTAECQVFEAHGTRERMLARLVIPAAATDAYDFAPVIGFESLQKNSDDLDVWFDEFRCETLAADASVVLPRDRRAPVSDWPVTVRIKKYDSATQTWKNALEIPNIAITSLTCTFKAHKIEESLSLTATDIGDVWSTRSRDLLRDIARDANANYRIDVYCQDESFIDPQYPATWFDGVVFWSGVLDYRGFAYDSASRSISIQAYGWSSMLERVNIESLFWAAGTAVTTVVDDVVDAINSAWPGTVVRESDVTYSSVSDAVTPTDLLLTNLTATEALERIAGAYGFFYAVVVSGYPLHESGEFRLLFMQPRSSTTDASWNTASVCEEGFVWRTLDVNDSRVVAINVETSDANSPTSYTSIGLPFAMDTYCTASHGADFLAAGSQNPRLVSITSPSDNDTLDGGSSVRDYVGCSIETLGYFITVGVTDAEFRLDPAANHLGPRSVYSHQFIDTLSDSTSLLVSPGYRAGRPKFPGWTYSSTVSRIHNDGGNAKTSRSVVVGSDDASVDGGLSETVDIESSAGWYETTLRATLEVARSVRSATTGRIVISNSRGEPVGQSRTRIALIDGTQRATIYGASGTGDGWTYGSDDRPLGTSIQVEARGVTATLSQDGWAIDYQLGDDGRSSSASLRNAGAI